MRSLRVPKTAIELTADDPIEGVVEVCGLDIHLRPGMNKGFVRHHPMLEAGIVGGRGYLPLPEATYTNRYTPSQVMVYEQDVEGIDIYAPGEKIT